MTDMEREGSGVNLSLKLIFLEASLCEPTSLYPLLTNSLEYRCVSVFGGESTL